MFVAKSGGALNVAGRQRYMVSQSRYWEKVKYHTFCGILHGSLVPPAMGMVQSFKSLHVHDEDLFLREVILGALTLESKKPVNKRGDGDLRWRELEPNIGRQIRIVSTSSFWQGKPAQSAKFQRSSLVFRIIEA